MVGKNLLAEGQSLLEGQSELEINILESETGVVDLKLNSPMKLPFGEVISRPSGIVRIEAEVNGRHVTGYGEGATLQKPMFTDDSAETIAGSSRIILDEISGLDSPEEILGAVQDVRFPDSSSNPTARMMVEMAVIDIIAKGLNQSVATLLGVPEGINSAPYGKSIGEGTSDQR
jgi:L-alanine-DL-glutamate epimerase-like enolase superfamily enzyme